MPVLLFSFPVHVGRLGITCRSASPPFPFPVYVGRRIMCMDAVPSLPFLEHICWLKDQVGACSTTSSIFGMCRVLIRLLVGRVFIMSAELIVALIVA